MRWIGRWVVSAFALLLVAWLFNNIWFDSLGAAFVAAFVLGLVNAVIKPVLQVFALPVTILTLGLFSLVINALLLLLTSSVVHGFHVVGFFTAFWGAIVLAIVNGILHGLLED